MLHLQYLRSGHWFLRFLRPEFLHCVIILALLFSHKYVLSTKLFLLLVKVVNDDTNE